MAVLRPANFNNTIAYAQGNRVYYNGTVYEARNAIAANASGNPIPVDNTNWKVYSVLNIEDYYSLQEIVGEILNQNNTEGYINNSIPAFIQYAEEQLNDLLYPPNQRVARVYQVDDDSKFRIPQNLNKIDHIRIDTDGAVSDYILDQGSIMIVSRERSTYEDLRQRYENDNYLGSFNNYQFPAYRQEGPYIYIAPKLDAGTRVELQYYQLVPNLGSTANSVTVINGVEFPINSAGQTLDQWIAAGNTEATFVQNIVTVTNNLWISMCPNLLKAGAVAEGFMQLENKPAADMWKEQFGELLESTRSQIDDFKTDQDQSPDQQVAY